MANLCKKRCYVEKMQIVPMEIFTAASFSSNNQQKQIIKSTKGHEGKPKRNLNTACNKYLSTRSCLGVRCLSARSGELPDTCLSATKD